MRSLILNILQTDCLATWNCDPIVSPADQIRSLSNRGAQDFLPTGFSLASLLVELCNCGFLPCEKRQCLRWCPGWWYQEWPGRGVLFLPSQVIQDLVYNVLVFDPSVRRIGDDFDRSPTAATGLDVDIEDAFKALRPGQAMYRHNRSRLSRWFPSQLTPACSEKPLALATRSSPGSGLSSGRMVRIMKALRPCCGPTAIR